MQKFLMRKDFASYTNKFQRTSSVDDEVVWIIGIMQTAVPPAIVVKVCIFCMNIQQKSWQGTKIKKTSRRLKITRCMSPFKIQYHQAITALTQTEKNSNDTLTMTDTDEFVVACMRFRCRESE